MKDIAPDFFINNVKFYFNIILSLNSDDDESL